MQDQNYHTVSEALEKYMALSGNNSTSLKMQYMVRALEVWKDIRNNTLRTTSHKWVQVDKSSLPYKAQLPSCASLFLNATIKNNCGEYVPLSKWHNMITTPYVDVSKKCECNNELKSCIESIEEKKENIVIQGNTYEKITKTKIYTNGDVYTHVTEPIEDTRQSIKDNQLVVYQFDVVMEIFKEGAPGFDMYVSDNHMIVANGADPKQYYYNIFDINNNNTWNNDDFYSCFKSTFRLLDNDDYRTGGFRAESIEAYDFWRNDFAKHCKTQLELNSFTIHSCNVSDVSTTEDNLKITRRAKLNIIAPNGIDFAYIQRSSLQTMDINFKAIGSDIFSPPYTYDNFSQNGGDYRKDVVVLPFCRMVTTESYVCNLKTKPCGCIEVSQENLQTIESCCCQEVINQCQKICNDYFTQPNDDYLSQNESGYFDYSEPNRYVYLYGSIPSQVMLNFQSTGEGESDELIPNYAFMTFVKGMDWINSRYSKTMNRLEKKQYEEEYSASKSELELKLPRNKMNIEDFNNPTKNLFGKW